MSKSLAYLQGKLGMGSSFGFGSQGFSPQNISGFISNIQFDRIAYDIRMWRDVVREMEQSHFPSRVMAQRMFMDTVENGQVKSMLERWRELTLQRDVEVFFMVKGKKQKSDVLTEQLQAQTWFLDYLEEVLNSILFGYSLIQLGDIENDGFPKLKAVRRENILPDGNGDGNPVLTNMTYAIDGLRFKDDKVIKMFNHWIPTKSTRGVSDVGYGLLYTIALYEIHLRHILEWNMDFVQGYGMPIKKGSTNKVGKDRQKFEQFLSAGASNQWILLDKGAGDDIVYEMAANAGTAWKTYDNVEARLEGVIARLLLGHTDAMISTPGKLGGQQAANKDGFNESLIEQAMSAKQTTCGNFIVRKINEISAPSFRALGDYSGSKIIKDLFPVGAQFGLLNDKESIAIRKRTNAERSIISTYVKSMNDAGWDIDQKQLSDLFGMKLTPSIPEKKLIEERNTTSTTTTNNVESTTAKKDDA